MRASIAGIAIFVRHHEGERQWLAQWNDRWRCFNFVGGHKHDDESFRECVIREVQEELHLRNDVDFVVSDARRSHLEYEAWSKGLDEETAYTIELFDVALASDKLAERLTETFENRWLSNADIARHRCSDGAVVSETMGFLLERAGLLVAP